MFERWRLEIAKHERVQVAEVVLPPVAGPEKCHCYRGMGCLRKRRPFGHRRPRCLLCKWRKLFPSPTRAQELAAAIDFELTAWGDRQER